jgi:hypothetical protein
VVCHLFSSSNLIGWVAAKLRFSISEAIKQVDLLQVFAK